MQNKSVIILGCFFIPLAGSAVEIAIPSVSVNTGECFAINVELYKVEDVDIYTSVIAFAFDPFKIQIGCNTIFNLGTYNEPTVYEQDSTTDEQPIVLSDSLKNMGLKYRVAIYPQGLMVVVLWDSTDRIPSGLLFSIPCKLTDRAIPGDRLIAQLISKEEPFYIRRSFPDNNIEWQSFYCSLADVNALPVNPTLVSGIVYVKSGNDGEPQEGEGEGLPLEGTAEGSPPEGDISEGNSIEGNTSEGSSLEGNPTEGEKPICGCRRKSEINRENIALPLRVLEMADFNIGFIIALVVILRRL